MLLTSSSPVCDGTGKYPFIAQGVADTRVEGVRNDNDLLEVGMLRGPGVMVACLTARIQSSVSKRSEEFFHR